TPRYLSPEVLQGARPDSRSDLYSLGVVLYECWKGSLHGSLGDHLLRTRQGKFYQEVREQRLGGPLGALIERLLDPDPESRLASGGEGLAILEESQRSRLPQAARPREIPPVSLPSFEAVRPVGCGQFFDALSDALKSITARRPRPALLAVDGAHGLGKSRLLREAVGKAFLAGVRSFTWPMLKALLSSSPPGEEWRGAE